MIATRIDETPDPARLVREIEVAYPTHGEVIAALIRVNRELAAWRAKQPKLDELADILGVCEGVCPLSAAMIQIRRLRALLAAIAGETR